jgi:hypothetical protein
MTVTADRVRRAVGLDPSIYVTQNGILTPSITFLAAVVRGD